MREARAAVQEGERSAAPAGAARGVEPGRRAATERLAGAGPGGPAAAELVDVAGRRIERVGAEEMAALEAAARAGDAGAAERAHGALRLTLAASRQDLTDAEVASAELTAEELASLRARVAAVRSVLALYDARGEELLEDSSSCRPAALGLSDRRLEFGATEIEEASAEETLWIRNLSARPVSVDELCAVGGASGDFEVAGECGRVLEPGAALRVEIRFRPRALGRRQSTLHVFTGGGVSSAKVPVRGRGVEPTRATRDRRRVDVVTRDLRGDAAPAPPQTFGAMRDLLRAAQQLEATGDRTRARGAVDAVDRALRHVTSPARRQEVLGRLGLSRTAAEQMLGSASGAVYSIRAKLDIDATLPWEYHLGQFEVGREPLELLTHERSDSPMFRAGHEGGLMVAGGATALLAGLAAAPAVATEIGLLAAAGRTAAAAGRTAASTAKLWALHNSQVALAGAELAASQAIAAADAGSISAWADNLTTREGLLDLAVGGLLAYDASLAARLPRGTVLSSDAAGARRHGPVNPGPIPTPLAATFRGGAYTSVTLHEPAELYRVYSGDRSRRLGVFWTRTPPSGPGQAQIDLALRPEWGNTAEHVVTIRVPAGTTIYEGAAESQGLVGGGSQVILLDPDPNWITSERPLP